tara:strand:+ start:132 stop:950 length:819 start_codon:yes stop_codon:yes gene_type:complete
MESIASLYRQQIEYNISRTPYIGDFKKNPYSYLKARYYVFFSSLILYFIQNKNFNPNLITKTYIIFGFIGAIFLSIPQLWALSIAIFLIFSKGILDWADGSYARLKNKESLTGHILDLYGAVIHSLTFFIGIGFYEFFFHDKNIIFLATLFIYPFCYGTLLTKFSSQYILEELSNFKGEANKDILESTENVKKKYPKTFYFFSNFLDDRSRTVDFVLLLILIENLGGPSLSWIFFAGLNIKWIIIWVGSFLISSKNKSADNIFDSVILNLKK